MPIGGLACAPGFDPTRNPTFLGSADPMTVGPSFHRISHRKSHVVHHVKCAHVDARTCGQFPHSGIARACARMRARVCAHVWVRAGGSHTPRHFSRMTRLGVRKHPLTPSWCQTRGPVHVVAPFLGVQCLGRRASRFVVSRRCFCQALLSKCRQVAARSVATQFSQVRSRLPPGRNSCGGPGVGCACGTLVLRPNSRTRNCPHRL